MAKRALRPGKLSGRKKPQITAYLTADERKNLRTYSAEFGLDLSGLATLLLVRHLRVARRGAATTPEEEGRPDGRDKKVTIHRVNQKTKELWVKHAKASGLSLSAFVGSVCIRELEEKWLASCFDSDRVGDVDSDRVGG